MNCKIHKRHYFVVFSQQWQLTLLSWGFCNVYSAVIFAQQILLIMSVTEGAAQVHCLCKCNVGFKHLTHKVRLVQHFTSCDKILSHVFWHQENMKKKLEPTGTWFELTVWTIVSPLKLLLSIKWLFPGTCAVGSQGNNTPWATLGIVHEHILKSSSLQY